MIKLSKIAENDKIRFGNSYNVNDVSIEVPDDCTSDQLISAVKMLFFAHFGYENVFKDTVIELAEEYNDNQDDKGDDDEDDYVDDNCDDNRGDCSNDKHTFSRTSLERFINDSADKHIVYHNKRELFFQFISKYCVEIPNDKYINMNTKEGDAMLKEFYETFQRVCKENGYIIEVNTDNTFKVVDGYY